MLHFGVTAAGHTHIWGQRLVDRGSDYENDLRFISAKISPPSAGQRLGGIGFYRTETGQPRFNEVDGAYLFNTYVTTYSYVNGQYSFALIVAISLAETLNLIEAPTYNTNYAVALAESFNAADTIDTYRKLLVALSETLNIADTFAFQGIYGVVLSENLVTGDTADTNAALVAYVVNQNNGAVTTYNNFNINSFAELNGKFYGMADSGIVELTGNTDLGVTIDTSIKLGTTDLSSEFVSGELLKRLPMVYLGISTQGNMLLKVSAVGATRTYRMVKPVGTGLHTCRLITGKGVVSRYWDLELLNEDGGDFTLESMTLRPVALGRRIKGV